MSEKRDLQKAVNNSLAKILEDLIAILETLKSNKTQAESIQNLFIAKRRIINLTEQSQIIFKNLVKLKYLHSLESNFKGESDKNRPEEW